MNNNNKYIAPYKIVTLRTVMRCWNPRDAKKMQEAINLSIDSLLPWMPWARNEPGDFSTKIAAIQKYRDNFDLGIDFVYGIFTTDETEVIGSQGLEIAGDKLMEIGCWINKKFQSQGYSTETTKALVKAAFELSDIHNIQISFNVKNRQSLRVVEKSGFKIQSTLPQINNSSNDESQMTTIATLSRNDYAKSDIKKEFVTFYDLMGQKI